jgi:predicted permease
MLLQNKLWTAVVVLSLGLGMGANTTLFSAANALLLQTIPVWQPSSLVRLRWTGQNQMVSSSSDYGYGGAAGGQNIRSTFSYATFQQLRASNRTLSDMFACAPAGRLNVALSGDTELASGLMVSGGYFDVLGVGAHLGRTITSEDDTPTAPPVAMISHGYWLRRFGGKASVVGAIVHVNGTPLTIVGVTPPGYTGIQRANDNPADVHLPLALDPLVNPRQTPPPSSAPAPPPLARLSQPTFWWLQIMGRLKPGATLEQVHGNLSGVFQQSARDGLASFMAGLTPEERSLSRNQNRTAVPNLLVSSGSHGVYDADPGATRLVTILGAVVVLVLLLVCANVANLLLSRASARQREISVRLSVGASRGRLVRQLLTESLVLALLGGTAGALVGYWSRQLLPFGQTAPFDARVFLFVVALSVLAGVTFGLAPALRATRVDLSSSLKEGSRGAGVSRTLLGRSLLVGQVAISLMLLIGAGLFLRTLDNLRRVDVGFDTQNLLLFNVSPGLNRYTNERIEALYRQMAEGLRALPGVRSVSLSRNALLSGGTSTSTLHMQGRTTSGNTHVMTVSPEFLDTLGIRILAGRGFTARDDRNAPRVAIINETAARQFFPDSRPLGRRFGYEPDRDADFEIIGVFADTKYNDLRAAAPPTAYFPLLQNPSPSATFEVRTAADPTRLTSAVREAVRRIDPNLPIQGFTTQAEQIERRYAQERLSPWRARCSPGSRSASHAWGCSA